MDAGTFLERYGYNILLAVILGAVGLVVIGYPLMLIWRRFGASMVISLLVVTLLGMGIYQLIRRGTNLATTTAGKVHYLNRTKYFESKRDVENEEISDKIERGNI